MDFALQRRGQGSMWKCEEKRDRFRRDALAAWTNYQTTGLFATVEEADAWLAKLEAGEKAAPPILHGRSEASRITGREHK
jgi:predicted transcriptional regulator